MFPERPTCVRNDPYDMKPERTAGIRVRCDIRLKGFLKLG